MDETMVSNVKDRKKGVGVNRKRKKKDNANASKCHAASRCSLLACVTNDQDIQRHLPSDLLAERTAR